MSEVKTEWRPIETAKLPRFSRRDFWNRRFVCLICSEHGVGLGVYSFTGSGDGVWSHNASGPSRRAYPTHWMPLPDPPYQGE